MPACPETDHVCTEDACFAVQPCSEITIGDRVALLKDGCTGTVKAILKNMVDVDWDNSKERGLKKLKHVRLDRSRSLSESQKILKRDKWHQARAKRALKKKSGIDGGCSGDQI